MVDRLRVGVAGAGVFGGYHADKYSELDNVDLVAVFDTEVASAKRLADKHGAQSHDNFETFLDSVDAVSIATPATTHFDYGMRAAQAKKSAYIEKPLAVNSSDGRLLVKAFKEAGVALVVGHQERHILERLGVLDFSGAVSSIEFARCGASSGRCMDVSVVYDLMIHDLDFAALLGLTNPSMVDVSGDRDETIATLQFPGGASASFVASRKSQSPKRLMKLRSADTVVEIDFFARKITKDGVQRGFDDVSSEDISDPLLLNVEKFVSLSQNNGIVGPGASAGETSVAMAEKIEFALNGPEDLFDYKQRLSA